MVRDVASYGKQLGWVIEALQILATETKTDLKDIDWLQSEIEKVKTTEVEALRRRAEDALARLEEVDRSAYDRVMRR